MLPHPPCDVSYDLMAVFKFDSKLRSRQGFYHRSGEFDYFLIFGHKYNPTNIPDMVRSCKEYLQKLTVDTAAVVRES
jgi:hypothetical protein